jgi:Family of unknown function (DUF6088)
MKSVRRVHTNTGHLRQAHRGPAIDLKARILDRMRQAGPVSVWTPSDFLGLGSRAAIDKALQRLAISDEIRRIDRGLYDIPRVNRLTGKPANPDYTAVIDAVARRDQARLLVDGITAANQLGLTHAVPARVTVHTDARIRPIRLGNMTINFKLTAPSRLYWAGRPAMRVVQALHWLRDMVPSDKDSIQTRLKAILNDPTHGPTISDDLQKGLHTLPQWMHELVNELLTNATRGRSENASNTVPLSPATKEARDAKQGRRTRN